MAQGDPADPVMDGYSGGWIKPVLTIAAGIIVAGLVIGLFARR